MKSPFFKNLFIKEYDLYKEMTVLDFMKGWLQKHDKELFNFFNNALQGNKDFIQKELFKLPLSKQFEYLNKESLGFESILKKNRKHWKILFKKIKEVDELYDAKEIRNFVSLTDYPQLEAYFSLFHYHRNNLEAEHFQDADTAIDILQTTRSLLNDFKIADKTLYRDFYYPNGENLTGLANYMVFVEYCLQGFFRLKPIKEKLIEEHPELLSIQPENKETKVKPDLQKNLIEKLPLEWKTKPFSEYFLFHLNQNYPKECRTFELEEMIEQRKIQQKIKNLKQEEQASFIKEEITIITEVLTSPEIEPCHSMFSLSMEEYCTNLNLELELAYLIKESDDYTRSKEDLSRSEDVINKAELLAGLPTFSSNVHDSKFKEAFNYLDKSMLNPRISGFLMVKSYIDRKAFLYDLLNGSPAKERGKGESKNEDSIVLEANKTERNDFISKDDLENGGEQKKWYEDNAPFLQTEGRRKILLDMTPQQERTFLSFFCRENNGTASVFLSDEETQKLAIHGLSLDLKPTDIRFKLNLDQYKRPKKIILYSFWYIFKKYGRNKRVKNDLALFLKYNIENFKDLSVDSIRNEMRGKNEPKLMNFKIDTYL